MPTHKSPEKLFGDYRVSLNQDKQYPTISIHRWWARRPAWLARIITFLSLTDSIASSPDFLIELANTPPSSKTLQIALNKIRDNQWFKLLREAKKNPQLKDDPVDLTGPRLLDPFAGSGTIPLEALRLGCETYAGDLNPVSFNLLKSTLKYPQLHYNTDPNLWGTGANNIWNGLSKELEFWIKEIERRVIRATQSLFPAKNNNGDLKPCYYLWTTSVRCAHPDCNIGPFPAQMSYDLRYLRKFQNNLVFEVSAGKFVPAIKVMKKVNDSNKEIICPVCGAKYERSVSVLDKDDGIGEMPFLGAVVLKGIGTDKKRSYACISPEDIDFFAPWKNENQSRLDELLRKPHIQLIFSPINFGNNFSHSLDKWGITTFQDLFSKRQLLVGLEFTFSILDVISELKMAGMHPEKLEALTTYLGMWLGYIIEHNSKLCRWKPYSESPTGSFDIGTFFYPKTYVERDPEGFADEWIRRIQQNLQNLQDFTPAQRIYCGDAARLPFDDDYFDSIVTDPPYYDNIPYADLADFFWVWESAILTEQESIDTQQEFIINQERKVSDEVYIDDFNKKLLAVFRECFRVLKPGGTLSILLTTRSGFENYVSILQDAGYEVISIKGIPESLKGKEEDSIWTLLVFVRKPYSHHSISLIADPDTLAVAIDQGKSVLYPGLAEMLEKELLEEDYKKYIPVGAKGSKIDILMEIIANCDLQEFLEDTLGTAGLRRIAKELGFSDISKTGIEPVHAILSSFGFSIPSLAKEDGARQVEEKLRQLRMRIQRCQDKSEIRGPFLDGCSAVERLLRYTVWGWVQLAYGREKRDQTLIDILHKVDTQKLYRIDRLAFGDIVGLFREIPYAILLSPETETIRLRIGRPHIYNPKSKKTKFSDRLGNFVSLRNKVEHDKDRYWTDSSLEDLIKDFVESFQQTEQLIKDLSEEKAIPHFVVPKLEIKDLWGRVSYKLIQDDGSEFEAAFTTPLKLGRSYMFFPNEVNPRPVDPLILPVDEVEPIP